MKTESLATVAERGQQQLWTISSSSTGARTGNVLSTAGSYRQRRELKAGCELLQYLLLFLISVTLHIINKAVL